LDSPFNGVRIDRAPFFILRTPLLPFDTFLEWSADLEAPRFTGDADRLSEAIASDRKRLQERLLATIKLPEVREALFLASPDLHEALERTPVLLGDKKSKRLERALVRYFSRMCGRSTPFGLFAGYSVGLSSADTKLTIDARCAYRRHTRLDMHYMTSLTEALAADEQIRRDTVYRANSSIYECGGTLRYFERRRIDDALQYHLVTVEPTRYLLETLSRCEPPQTASNLASALITEDIRLEDADRYISALIDSQILVSELEPRATGNEPLEELMSTLASYPSGAFVNNRLKYIKERIHEIDAAPLGTPAENYVAIAEELSPLPAKVEISRLLQVDLVKPAPDATLGAAVIDEITESVQILYALRPPAESEDLVDFRRRFRARYENRAVPLFEVLDEETGIGFGARKEPNGGAALAAGRPSRPSMESQQVRWDPIDTLLLNKLNDRARAHNIVIKMNAREISAVANANRIRMPAACSAVVRIAAASQEALYKSDFQILLHGVSGPSGANFLGRFCHGDSVLQKFVENYFVQEESLQPDAVFAEIVHLPEGRIGNVILRPSLRNHEIPFLGQAAVDSDHQFQVSDLLVSVSDSAITLFSRRLGKQVIPRLTSAHNFQRGLAIYRFLCALQLQHGGGASWSWGALDGARTLPRVVTGRTVLALARWRVDRSELQPAIDAVDAARYSLVQEWRAEREVPRFIVLAEGDNTLPIDLDNILSVDVFVEQIKRRAEFRLYELFPPPDELCVSGPEGRYTNELVIPLILRREAASTASTSAKLRESSPVARSYGVGSEWLFMKLYTGHAGADRILADVVGPLSGELVRDKIVDRWYFIRYGEPDWHLRVRFHGESHCLHGDALLRLHTALQPFCANGLVWKMEASTYEREIERYGGSDGVLLSEQLFQIDSEAVLQILAALSDQPQDIRSLAALRGIDQLLDDLWFDLPAKLRLISETAARFLGELGAPPSLEHQLAARFRSQRRSIESVLDHENDRSSVIAQAIGAVNTRSQHLRPITAALYDLSASGRLSVSVESLAVSYIHMFANRLLRTATRQEEAVLHHFLMRAYKSRLARSRTKA